MAVVDDIKTCIQLSIDLIDQLKVSVRDEEPGVVSVTVERDIWMARCRRDYPAATEAACYGLYEESIRILSKWGIHCGIFILAHEAFHAFNFNETVH